MGRRRKTSFEESLELNTLTYSNYLKRLLNLAVSCFKWSNLPDTIDPRFLELTLFRDGQAVFFKDEVMGYLALQNSLDGDFNVYHIPNRRRAYAVNGYSKKLTIDDSVIIYNNYLHNSPYPDIKLFARRLYEIDRTIDVNVKAQKTPLLIQCDENERLTILNLYKDYDGNEPFIFGSRQLNPKALTAISTEAPYLGDKLYLLKSQIWNEALAYLGIANINYQKRERLVSDEVQRSMGGTIALRYSRLNARQEACEKINKMFGLDIWCEFRDELDNTLLNDGASVSRETLNAPQEGGAQ